MLTVDTAADTFGGNEIDRQQVRRYIQGCLTSLSLEFDLALALLAHPSASGLANGSGTVAPQLGITLPGVVGTSTQTLKRAASPWN